MPKIEYQIDLKGKYKLLPNFINAFDYEKLSELQNKESK